MRSSIHNGRKAGAVILALSVSLWMVLTLVGCSDPAKPAAPAKKADDKAKVSQIDTNAVVLETKAAFDDDPKTTKDPFFPSSKRRLSKPAIAKSGGVPEVSRTVELRLRGVVGSPGRFIATINDKTFAEGDKSQVSAGPNQTLVVKVTKITERSVTVVVDGEPAPRELTLDTIQEARK
jgi:hypothetical protein